MIDLASTRVGSDAEDRPRPFWLSVAVFAIGLLVSLTVGWLLHAREAGQRAAALQTEVAGEAQALQEHLLHLVMDVQVLTQFHAASETVTADEFARFVRPFLERHPGLLALGWLPRVADDRRAAFEAAARAEGLADFVIHDRSDGPIHPAPPRPEYFPVLRLASPNRDLDRARALGFDHGADPRRRAAMERAAATGQPAVTPPLRPIQAPQGSPALFVFAPLFSEIPSAAPELRGFALGIIRTDALLNEVRSSLPLRGLDRMLRAADADGAADLLEILPSRRRAPGARLDAAALARDPRGAEARLTVADRTLILRGVPLPGARPLSLMPQALTGLGLLLSLTLALGLHHRRRGLQRLRAHAESLQRYRHIVETASEMLVFVDRDLRYQVVNPAYAAFHRTTPEALRGRLIAEVERPEIQAQMRPHLEASLAGERRNFTICGLDPSGQARWIAVEQRPFVERNLIAGIVVNLHDLTEIREAQLALEAERAHLEERVTERTDELHQLAERLQLATAAGGIGVWEWNTRTNRLIWDARMLALYGARETEFDGSFAFWFRRVHPEDAAQAQGGLENTLHGESGFSTEFRIRWPDGSIRWIAAFGKAIRDTQGEPRRMIGVNWDITDRKAAEAALLASEARARAIIDASPVPFAINEAQERIAYLNPAFVRIFGYTLAEIPTLAHWWPLAYPDSEYRQRIVAAWQARLEHSARTGEPFVPLEARIQARDGRTLTVLASATAIESSARDLYLVSLYDVTELQQAREQAEQAARATSAFLAHMSHEIRNPMNAVVGLSELALRRPQPLDPVTRDDLEHLHRSARNLLGILDDILDQSKIEAGRLTLDPAPFAAAALLEDLRTLFAATAAERGLTLTLAADPALPAWLVGDVLRLRQVLSNLLGNALKFTERGQVRLEVAVLTADGASARLRWTVEDTGLGMDAATQARLFVPFAQGDDSITRRFGGTGLGLSISRALVELMGGRLQLASVPGAGSRFWFELTLPAAAAAPVDAASAPAVDLNGARILVAEDQPVNRKIIAEMLKLLGIESVLAADGQAALDRLADAPAAFDAVLMDIQMPVLDGLSATRRLRADPRWSELPVIALTGGVTAEERQRIQAAGMSDLIAKPVTLDALSAALGRWLAGRARSVAPVSEPARLEAQPAWPEAETAGFGSESAAMAPPGGTEAPEAPLVLPGFELVRLLTFLERADIVELLRQFAWETDALPAALADALAAGRFDQARADAHRLKGVAANIGAVALAEAAERLEETLRDNRHDPERLDALRQAYAAALAAIATLAPTAAAPPSG